ncbi:hypothetical protein RhiJN_15013 [Ceratobasidium sp. AG-Ba]|nr:hypothetical protein RhiJN_15013 [Ceratobasidium sp. AG-Ba]
MTGSKVGRGSSVAHAASSSQPPQKKARSAKTSTVGPKKRGKLSFVQLLDLPPEVFSEIAKHLMPVDLLSFARSNTFFRTMLISRTSQPLWKAAIRNVPNMPECPLGFSEPEYISLLYTKICTMCGAKALRPVDPYLLARLCSGCHNESTQVVLISDPIYSLVPRSPMSKDREPLFCTTYKSEYDEVQRECARRDPGTKWRKTRKAEVDQRQKYGKRLQQFLDSLDKDKAMEAKEVLKQRLKDIKARIMENGWSAKDMKPDPANCYHWDQLVRQPKPITNRSWAHLYPKLIPLLDDNHEYHERIGRLRRKQGRLDVLQSVVSKMRKELPPLVHVTAKLPSSPHDPNSSAVSTPGVSATKYHDIKIDMPFPSTDELLRWPIIKGIIKDDITPEEASAKFSELSQELDQAVSEWRAEVEEDLIDIWEAGEEAETAPGPVMAWNTPDLGSSAIQLGLPEFTVTFGNPDGTTTNNILDLSPGMQLLLRADTMFKGHDVHHTYPTLVPCAAPTGTIRGSTAEWNTRGRWKPKRFSRDDDASAVAAKLLALICRPDATSAETRAFGARFECGRCTVNSPMTWDRLVQHYAREQRQWKQAKENIQLGKAAKSKVIYRNTHDLGPADPRPFARLVKPSSGISAYRSTAVMECVRCERIGVSSHYDHENRSGSNAQSPLVGHLKDVHEVVNPVHGVDFCRWSPKIVYGASGLDDDTDEDSSDEDDFYGYEDLYAYDDDSDDEGQSEGGDDGKSEDGDEEDSQSEDMEE